MKRAFSLLELMIAIIIIGILATLALPQYTTAVERAKAAKAKNALVLISKAEKMYNIEKNAYIKVVLNQDRVNDKLVSYIELSEVDEDEDWSYGVGLTESGGFNACALRKHGPYANKHICLTDDGKWEISTEGNPPW